MRQAVQKTRIALTFLLAVSLAGCEPGTTFFGAGLPDRDSATRGSGRAGATTIGGRVGERQSIIRPGTGEFLNDGAVSEPLIKKEGERTSLNLIDVPVADAARAVLDEALNISYVIDPLVQGTVTIQTSMPVGSAQLLDIFQGALEFNGATLRRDGSNVSIVPLGSTAPQIALLGDNGVLGPRVVAVPLGNIGASEATRLLTPIVGQSVSITAVPNRSILLISGSRDEVNAAIEAINVFDVDVLKGKSVAIFRLRSADPESIVAELDQIFESFPGGALEGAVSFVPNRRLGAVVAIATKQRHINEARTWIGQLDATANQNRRRPTVYPIENRSAEDLAPIVAELVSSGAAAGDGPVSDGEVRVIADNARNAVVVWGNADEQQEISWLIASLDSTPVQVMLEATIAEVTLRDELEFGVQWFLENGNFAAELANNAAGTLTRPGAGLSLIFDAVNDQALISALASITNVDIVSSPSLMVLDNETATLQIGDEVPVATQTVTDPTDANPTTVISNISFRETGILLTVRPRVSKSGVVTLEIEQEVSSVSQTTTSGIDSPTISQRKISTRVQVDDQETIALGGLIQDNRSDTSSGVPGLKDLPIVGSAFRNKSDSRERTELLVLITPNVVRNGNEARQVSEEFRRRLAGPDGLVRGREVTSGLHRILR